MQSGSAKIALITSAINGPGGLEYVVIAAFNSLRKLGKVRVLGREKVANFDILARWVPTDLAHAISNNYEYMPKFPLNLVALKGYDIVINMHSNVILSSAHIHYLNWIFSPYGIKDPEVLAYYRRACGEISPIRSGIRHVLHYLQLKTARLVLANSSYVANLLKELGVNAEVLYPPVRSKEIARYTSGTRWNDREKLVITIARIAPEKQLELIPLIASRVKDAKFIIVGSLYNENYYVKLLKLGSSLEVRNFTILPNIPSHKLYELLSKAMIYLHPTPHEHFGIAVVEGMAAGCIPVVHESGGPYHDIVREGYGFSYKDLEEATNIIKDIIHNRSHYKELSEEVRQRSLIFDESVFSSKLRNFVKNIIHDRFQ